MELLANVALERVGAGPAEELWMPADELDQFNRMIVGKIEVINERSIPELAGRSSARSPVLRLS